MMDLLALEINTALRVTEFSNSPPSSVIKSLRAETTDLIDLISCHELNATHENLKLSLRLVELQLSGGKQQIHLKEHLKHLTANILIELHQTQIMVSELTEVIISKRYLRLGHFCPSRSGNLISIDTALEVVCGDLSFLVSTIS